MTPRWFNAFVWYRTGFPRSSTSVHPRPSVRPSVRHPSIHVGLDWTMLLSPVVYLYFKRIRHYAGGVRRASACLCGGGGGTLPSAVAVKAGQPAWDRSLLEDFRCSSGRWFDEHSVACTCTWQAFVPPVMEEFDRLEHPRHLSRQLIVVPYANCVLVDWPLGVRVLRSPVNASTVQAAASAHQPPAFSLAGLGC